MSRSLHPAERVVRENVPAAPARTSVAALDAARAPGLSARVAVLGAGGYVGQEWTRLALRHPGLRVALLVTRDGGVSVADLLPGLDPRAAPEIDVAGMDEGPHACLEHDVDLLVSCLPHGAWRELAPRFERPGLRVVDLSSDHRDGSDGYVYGLPEAFRGAIAGAERVANPGCFPTAVALALLPALESGWNAGPVVVSAVSGVSGAGRGAALRTSFVERDGNAELYRAGGEHAHVAEMEHQLGRVAGGPVPVSFAPMLAPMARGILAVAHAPLARAIAPDQATAMWTERYRDEPFVRVLPAGQWPDTRAVRGSNRTDVAVTTLHGGRTLLAASAIDNLVKGAAGQAIQNANLMLGWPETTGLPRDGAPW
jgi:N-acetyl-gamma-glutamyl-phosphate reductase